LFFAIPAIPTTSGTGNEVTPFGDKLNLIGSAAGFNVRKLLSLLGTGIFSRALLVWDGFCRFLSSWLRSFGVFSAA
jgi:hypothetical protein